MTTIRLRTAISAILLTLASHAALAQLSLASAVDLALKADPRVGMAQADLAKSRAALSEAHDAFIPAVGISGGVGRSIGPPLGIPVVFSIAAQSLVFNFSQPDYIRAAHAGINASTFALQQVRNDVIHDTVDTYIQLEAAQQRKVLISEATSVITRLTAIVQERFDAGLDPHVDLTRTRRTAAALRLQYLQNDDEIADLSEKLAWMTGLGSTQIATVHDSIPSLPPVAAIGMDLSDTPGIKAAFASASAKSYTAHGDNRYRWRPQFGFAANYSRISTAFTNYGQYYPQFVLGNPNFNALSVGIQLSIPLLDYGHQARARGTAADALHARLDAQNQRIQFLTGRHKLVRSAGELAANAELAALDRDLADDQLAAVQLQLQGSSSTEQMMTPKDEQNAQLQKRQRGIDLLAAQLKLQQAEIDLMSQAGELSNWVVDSSPHSGVTAGPAGR